MKLKSFIVICILLIASTVGAVDYYPKASCADQGSTGTGCAKALVDAIGGSKNATIVFQHNSSGDTTSYTLGTSLTIPTNVTVRIEKGAQVAVATTKTLTINSPFEAGPYQVFSLTGTGSVVFTNRPEGWAEWWGFSTAASGATNAAALNSAIRALSKAKMGSGTFACAVNTIEWPVRSGANILEGQGRYNEGGYGTVLDFSASDTGTCITAGPITPASWTESQGVIELRNFQIKGGATDYTSDQIGLDINGISHSHIHDLMIYYTGYAMRVRGWENKFDDISIFNTAATPSRIGIWLSYPAFDNIFTRMNIYHEIFGVVSGSIDTTPFDTSTTVETNYTNGNTFMQPNFGGIKAYDTGGGEVGGICFQLNNGTYRPSILYGWAEDVYGPDGSGSGGIYCKLGNIKTGSETVHAPIIKGNYMSGDSYGVAATAAAFKIIRARAGEISSNYIIQNFNTMFDLNDVGEWDQCSVYSNYKQAGDSWDSGSYASTPEIARVPAGGTAQIYGNTKVTGDLWATTGLMAGASASNGVMGFYTGSVASGATYDFAIPTNTGGLMVVVEDGANDYALVMFNNDAGTLAATEVMDAGNHVSVSGNNLRITNGHGGAARYYVTFIGRNVDLITGP